MKKQSLLLMGGALLACASCQQENTAGGFTQEQVDSIVNVRVQEQMITLQASNDSVINAVAQWKADSIIAAMKGNAPATPKPTTRNTTVNNGGGTATESNNTRGGIQSKSDQNKSETRGGIESKSDQAKSEEKSSGRRGGIQSKSDQAKQQ